MAIAKLVGKSGKDAIISESSWKDFFQQIHTAKEINWETICGVGGKFVMNLIDSSAEHDITPFSQVAAEYAALQVLDAITTLTATMTMQDVLKHLENSVYALKPQKNKQSSSLKGIFSSCINEKSSVSLLFRTFDTKEIKEIRVHDLFALPGMKVAGQFYRGELCNPSLFGSIDGTMDLVTLRSADIIQEHLYIPADSKTNRDRAWEFLNKAIANKALTSLEQTTLQTMIAENKSIAIECCSVHASYQFVLNNWKALVYSRSLPKPPALTTSSPSLSPSETPSAKALSFVSQAFEQHLITPEERVQLFSLISKKDEYIFATLTLEKQTLKQLVDMWKIHLK